MVSIEKLTYNFNQLDEFMGLLKQLSKMPAGNHHQLFGLPCPFKGLANKINGDERVVFRQIISNAPRRVCAREAGDI